MPKGTWLGYVVTGSKMYVTRNSNAPHQLGRLCPLGCRALNSIGWHASFVKLKICYRKAFTSFLLEPIERRAFIFLHFYCRTHNDAPWPIKYVFDFFTDNYAYVYYQLICSTLFKFFLKSHKLLCNKVLFPPCVHLKVIMQHMLDGHHEKRLLHPCVYFFSALITVTVSIAAMISPTTFFT